MLRLAHRILSQRTIPHVYQDDMLQTAAALVSMARALLTPKCPVILADNVFTYLNERRRTRTGIGLFSDYPPTPPPFPYFFIESNLPQVIYSGVTSDTQSPRQIGYFQQGAVFVTIPDNDFRASKLTENYDSETIDKIKWMLVGGQFITERHGQALPLGKIEIALDEQGHVLTTMSYPILDVVRPDPNDDPLMAVHLMTMAFMQCRNVTRQYATATEGPPPKWCRRQRLPELKYQVLHIDPNIGAKSSAGERRTEGDRSGKALHICRGHFAHFVDDGISTGLFGRGQFGTFWIPAHTRGSAEHGRVVSTYNVKAPCNSQAV